MESAKNKIKNSTNKSNKTMKHNTYIYIGENEKGTNNKINE